MGLSIRGGKLPVRAQVRAAILELIPFLGEVLNPAIEGDGAGNFRANRRGVLEVEQPRERGANALREIEQDLPFRTSFGNAWAGNLRAEDHPPLGRGFG